MPERKSKIMNASHEEWKDIIGFCGRYQISNFGRVKRFSRVTRKERILKNSINNDGYFRVTLTNNRKAKYFYVHRLVATHFLSVSDRDEVNHKDLCKTNNAPENLEWVSRRENMKHAQKNGLYSPISNPNRAKKLSRELIEQIRLARAGGQTLVNIGKQFGIHNTTVLRIVRHERWK